MVPKLTRAVFYCDYRIDGPKVGAHVVAWRKYCRRRVKTEGEKCWQHDPEKYKTAGMKVVR